MPAPAFARPKPAHDRFSGSGIADTQPLRALLLLTAALVLLLMLVGGATRLTLSGLSITTWEPFRGILPPLSEQDWAARFAMYRGIPQYQQQNFGMTLAEFKVIFWWEWGHRFLARLVGLVYVVPLVILVLLRKVPPRLLVVLLAILALGGLQAYIGWFMVQSGLSELTSVSHYRLSVHFSLALAIYASLLWVAWSLPAGEKAAAAAAHDRPPLPPAAPITTPSNADNQAHLLAIVSKVLWQALRIIGSARTAMMLLVVQMVLGALTAGLHAGWVYNTWPLMEGRLVPDGLFAAPAGGIVLDDHMTVQWLHRNTAYLFALSVFAAWLLRHRAAHSNNDHAAHQAGTAGAKQLSPGYPRQLLWVMVLTAAQILLGIATLLLVVPLTLGLLHQAGGIVLFTATLAWLHHERRNAKSLSSACANC